MLFLLRKIRNQMLQKNKVTTYLLYAIGEIVLVVAGILIALQIDTWREEKELTDEEASYLNRLIDENKQDVESFNLILEDIGKAINSINELSEALNDESSSDSVLLVKIHQYMLYGSLAPIFNSSRSTFDDLSNTGNLKVISDLKLRNKVVQHYAEIQKTQERMSIGANWALALDSRLYSEMHGMKYVPSTAHLYPKKTTKELADELRKNKLEYLDNAAAGFWVNDDARICIEDLKMKSITLIKEMEHTIGIESQTLPDPLEAGWNNQPVCEVQEENEYVRVLKCSFPPGVGHERHYHQPHVGYTLAGGKMKITDANGTREVDVPTGSSFKSNGIEWHEVLNVGNTNSVYLIIEYK